MLWGFTCKCICTTVWHIFFYTTYILYVNVMFLNKRINPFFTFFWADATECSYASDGSDYVGTVSHTVTGLPCQMWDSNTPHTHDYNKLTQDQNYCRNTDSSKAPWCMTQDPSVRWGYCDVPRCGKMVWRIHIRQKPFFEDFAVELIHEIKCWMNLNF